jgi:hypothetical protein
MAVRREDRITELVCVDAGQAPPFAQDLSIVRIFSAVNVASRSEVVSSIDRHAMQPILLAMPITVWSIVVGRRSAHALLR